MVLTSRTVNLHNLERGDLISLGQIERLRVILLLNWDTSLAFLHDLVLSRRLRKLQCAKNVTNENLIQLFAFPRSRRTMLWTGLTNVNRLPKLPRLNILLLLIFIEPAIKCQVMECKVIEQ